MKKEEVSEEKSLFLQFFGDYPQTRVLDFLIENDVFDYSKKDIARNANVSWNTLESLWEYLEKEKIVAFTRKVGKSSMFKLNTENPAVMHLIEIDKKLMKKSMEELVQETKKEKTKRKEFA